MRENVKSGSDSQNPLVPLTSITSQGLSTIWGIDLVGELTKGKEGFWFAVVTMDYFTKWVEVEPLAAHKKCSYLQRNWKLITRKNWSTWTTTWGSTVVHPMIISWRWLVYEGLATKMRWHIARLGWTRSTSSLIIIRWSCIVSSNRINPGRSHYKDKLASIFCNHWQYFRLESKWICQTLVQISHRKNESDEYVNYNFWMTTLRRCMPIFNANYKKNPN